jgi:hypothetical protein
MVTTPTVTATAIIPIRMAHMRRSRMARDMGPFGGTVKLARTLILPRLAKCPAVTQRNPLVRFSALPLTASRRGLERIRGLL